MLVYLFRKTAINIYIKKQIACEFRNLDLNNFTIFVYNVGREACVHTHLYQAHT